MNCKGVVDGLVKTRLSHNAVDPIYQEWISRFLKIVVVLPSHKPVFSQFGCTRTVGIILPLIIVNFSIMFIYSIKLSYFCIFNETLWQIKLRFYSLEYSAF